MAPVGIRQLSNTFCVRFTYKHLLLCLFGFYFLLILIWMIFVHYADILQSTKHHPHYPSITSDSKKDSQIQQKNQMVLNEPASPKTLVNEIHTAYSVGCGSLMMWQLMQANSLDYSFYRVKQKGHLTRIVSGCNDDIEGIRWMSKSSIPISPDIHFLDNKEKINQCLENYKQNKSSNVFNISWDWTNTFHIIFVPSFDEIKKSHSFIFGDNIDRYPQLNRILGLYMLYHCSAHHNIQQQYMMILDPDFIFLQNVELTDLQNRFNLQLHHPVSAKYGLGSKWIAWLKRDGEKVNVDGRDSSQYYEGGVPYILHVDDWFNLIPVWMSYISYSYSNYNGIESDMYAYMIASYKLGLKHTLSELFMSTCMKSMDQNIHPFDDTNIFIHYCSSYRMDISQFALSEKVGDKQYTFNKHWTKARYHKHDKYQQLWLIECESPILIEPPKVDKYEKRFDSGLDRGYREAFKQYKLLHTIVPAFNEALIAFKQKYCANKTSINTERKIILHEATRDNGDVLYHIVNDL